MSDPVPPPDLEELLQHQGWVRGLARHLVAGEAEAEEVEQETWRRALEAPPRHAQNLRGWLASLVRSTVIQRHRAEQRRTRAHRRAEERQVSASAGERLDHPPERSERRETFELLHRLLMDLEEPYGEAIFLRYVEGLPPRRIAARLDLPVTTVKTRLHRGLELLRRRLRRAYGPDWRARCVIFIPTLPSAAASTLITLATMSKTTKFALAAAAALLAVPTWLLLGHDPEDPMPQEANRAHEVAVREPGSDQPRLSDPDRERSQIAARTWLRLVDDHGEPLPEAKLSVYRDGVVKGCRDRDREGFVWPLADRRAGFLSVRAPGRLPFGIWVDPSQIDRVVVPRGHELHLRNAATVDPSESLDALRLGIDSLTPDSTSPLFQYRAHWEGCDRDPLSPYSEPLHPQRTEAGARIWGLPRKWSGLALELDCASLDWQGAGRRGATWHWPLDSGIDMLTVELRRWPEWTVKLSAPWLRNEEQQHLQAHLRIWSEQEDFVTGWYRIGWGYLGPSLEDLTRTDFTARQVGLLPPNRPDGWTASLQVSWGSTVRDYPVFLPREVAEPITVELPPPVRYPVRVVDQQGQPLPAVEMDWPGARTAPGALTDEEGRFEYLALSGLEGANEMVEVSFTPTARGLAAEPTHLSLRADAETTLVARAADGLELSILLRDADGEIRADFGLQVELECFGEEGYRPGGLFGRPVGDDRDALRRAMPDASGWGWGLARDVWSVRAGLAPAVNLFRPSGDPNEPMRTRFYGLNPTHPVRLRVLAKGMEIYQEEFLEWPSGQLVRRELELKLPRTAQLSGFVIGTDGIRVREALVTVHGLDESIDPIYADAFGAFAAEIPIPSELRLSAEASRGRYVECEPVLVQPNAQGDYEAVLTLQPAVATRIRIEMENGEPFTGELIDTDLVGTKIELWRGRRQVEAGVFEIMAPVSGQVRVAVSLNSSMHSQVFEMGQGPHLMRIPEHLPFEVLTSAELRGSGARTVLRCVRIDPGESGVAHFDLFGSSRLPAPAPDAYQEALLLPPGRYSAQLRQRVGSGEWRELGEPIPFEIGPGPVPPELDLRGVGPLSAED